jgi:outer membrane lipoprotein-sorting protein
MVPTKIFNRTGVDGIRVREDNGDVINMWFDIPPKQFGRVVIEPHATHRRFRIAPSNLEINSDYCTDNKIVYVRMDNGQKLFLDPVPRTSTMVKKTITNRTNQRVVLKEVIDAKEGEHDIATTELEQLESRKSYVLEMDPEGGHRKYFMKVINDQREIEITERLKTSEKSWEVTFDASGNLSFVPVNGISVRLWQL